MSVSRPATRCLVNSTSALPKLRPRVHCQSFHSTQYVSEEKKPEEKKPEEKKPEEKKSEEKKSEEKKPPRRSRFAKPKYPQLEGPADKLFPAYTKEEKKALARRYTPAQLEAIEAGEKAIDPEDLKSHGVLRSDVGALDYLDDMSKSRPVIDKKDIDYSYDPNFVLDQNKIGQRFQDYMNAVSARLPQREINGRFEEGANPDDFIKRLDVLKAMTAELGDSSTYSTAPAIPANFEKSDLEMAKKESADSRDEEGRYDKLIRMTGKTLSEILSIKTKILVQNFVANTTHTGKVQSIYMLAIAGNGNGQLGIGEAKGQEATEINQNAEFAAIRNMKPITRYEERTIYGDVEGKVSATVVKLMARPPGFGVRTQGLIFEMARIAGIHDLAAKVPRSRNKMNTVKAAYQALMKQRIPDEIARGRGKKLVDVRKVYYAGRVSERPVGERK